MSDFESSWLNELFKNWGRFMLIAGAVAAVFTQVIMPLHEMRVSLARIEATLATDKMEQDAIVQKNIDQDRLLDRHQSLLEQISSKARNNN